MSEVSTPVISGKGSLHTADGKELVAKIDYLLRERSPEDTTTSADWWGGFVFAELIDSGEYILEIEDGRKGACTVRLIIDWKTCGVPDNYRYAFVGKSPLA